jgi:predicted nucleic acid-binding Zn ribbon protein
MKKEYLMDRFLQDGKTLKQAMDELMKKSHMDEKLLGLELKERWEEVAGSLVARHTSELRFNKNKLTIRLDSAPLKQEISYRKQALIDKINKGMGKVVVTEIVIR